MAMKLDMSKAYDRVEWDFLAWMMRVMNFPRNMIQMVMRCVQSVTFQVLLNGKPSRVLKPSRGIRQGDPLSPLLFIICSEGLSALIRQATRKKEISGLKMGHAAPELTHLFFADDSLIFLRAEKAQAEKMKNILRAYEEMAGQKINFHKSALLFGNKMPEARKMEL